MFSSKWSNEYSELYIYFLVHSFTNLYNQYKYIVFLLCTRYSGEIKHMSKKLPLPLRTWEPQKNGSDKTVKKKIIFGYWTLNAFIKTMILLPKYCSAWTH